MARTDVTTTDDMIVIHPDKLRTTKARIRAGLQARALATLRDSVIDEELDSFVELLVVNELAEGLRIEVRRKLEAGYRG